MICKTETDLHNLLDGLTDGEHIKATWKAGNVEVTAEGPVSIDGLEVSCWEFVRWDSGKVNSSLASVEVTREVEVTVTRDDEEALHELLDSLEGGETITAEWGNESGSISITGKARADRAFREVYKYQSNILRQYSGVLHHHLRSVTVRRTVVQRWERDGDA